MVGAASIPARIICNHRQTHTCCAHFTANHRNHSLLLATKPLELDILSVVTRTQNRKLTLLELLLDDLPATNHLLLVYRRDSPGVHLDVRELRQDAALLDLLSKLLGLGRSDESIHKVGDSLDAGEFAVGEDVTGHFLDALGSLYRMKSVC